MKPQAVNLGKADFSSHKIATTRFTAVVAEQTFHVGVRQISPSSRQLRSTLQSSPRALVGFSGAAITLT